MCVFGGGGGACHSSVCKCLGACVCVCVSERAHPVTSVPFCKNMKCVTVCV